jgi:hypothetical protein
LSLCAGNGSTLIEHGAIKSTADGARGVCSGITNVVNEEKVRDQNGSQ